jgi:hypothetical protein
MRPRCTGVPEPGLSIATDGDAFERRYWSGFASSMFSGYETFWVNNVAPLTYRGTVRQNIRFRTDAELAGDGFAPNDVAVGQLHYTFLLHVGRVWELLHDALTFTQLDARAGISFDANQFFESLARLSGASDVADELLERRSTPTYAAWDEQAGGRARRAWRKQHGDPLRDIRAYRNRLVHGRVVPQLHAKVFARGSGAYFGEQLMYPRLDRVDEHLDWRPATVPGGIEAILGDFDKANEVVRGAWERTIDYAECSWRQYLL